MHIIYRPTADQTPWSDAEFSRTSIAARRQAGYDDMIAALDQQPWLQPRSALVGARVHCFEAGSMRSDPPTLARTRGPRAA